MRKTGRKVLGRMARADWSLKCGGCDVRTKETEVASGGSMRQSVCDEEDCLQSIPEVERQ